MFICHEHGTKQKSESPANGSKEWPPRYRLVALTTELRETLGELLAILGFFIIHYTLDAFDIADPSSMQDACHI